MHVQVRALVTQPERVASNITNTFEFVFDVSSAKEDGSTSRRVLKRVLPSTEEEAQQLWSHFPGIAGMTSS